MRGPHGLEPNDSCIGCRLRGNGFFCQLSPAELKDFDALMFLSILPPRAVLFLEQQASRGIFVICAGELKLSCGSSEGRTLVLRIARPGEVLGLQSALSGDPYEVTAETLEPCQVAFVPQRDFRQFLREHPAVLPRVANHLGFEYKAACAQLRALGLSGSALERIARFLLTWSAERGASQDGVPFLLSLTHEEIAECAGISRESVTRALTVLRERGLIERQGGRVMIPNRAWLQETRTRRRISRVAASRLLRLTAASPPLRLPGARSENGRMNPLRIIRGGSGWRPSPGEGA